MKTFMPWFCLIATASTAMAQGNNDEGLDAYRQGHYWQAASTLVKDSARDPVMDYYLGRMSLYGYGELKNNALALRYFKRSADRGYVPAERLMAQIALNQSHDLAAALYWFKKVAEANDVKAQMYCAAAYRFGLGTKKNDDMERRYIIAAAKNGNAVAQYALAESFLANRQAASKNLGLIWLNKAVEKKNPAALARLGQLYATGTLVTQDKEKADTLMRAAVEQGYVPAWVMRADMAVSQGNDEAAKTWYTKAMDAGDTDAALPLAALYFDEKTSLYHPETGFLLTLQAAQKGSPQAALALAKLYQKGQGVAVDEMLAKEWTERASVLAKNKNTTPESEAVSWLSHQKASTWAASGYGLYGIFTAWQNPRALTENNYNAAPQLETISRASLYKPHFVMTQPNSIPLVDYYDAYVRLSKPQQSTLHIPRYSLAQPAVTQHLIDKAILGDSFAQFALGQLYQQGIGVDKNIHEAIKYYTQSAAQQDLRAEYNLGLIYLEGEAGKPDYQQALGWLNDAAFKGSADAQYVLGQLAEYGYRDANGADVLPIDNEQARSMYSLASANHQGLAQYRLAELLAHDQGAALSVAAKQKRDELMKTLYQGAASGGVHEAELPLAFFQAMSHDNAQHTIAFNVAKREADTNNNPQAILLLGLLYDRGIGVAASRDAAIEHYQKVENNPVSAFILGTYLANGDGLTRDLDQSRTLLKQALASNFSYAPLNLAVLDQQEGHDFVDDLVRAHELGNGTASLLLADYYLTQHGGDAQMKQARDIYQALADRGSPDGQMKLGYMYELGLGGTMDVAQAATWYEQAAAQGQSIAQYRLGRLNQLGWLTKQPDYEAAKKWYAEAMQGYVPAAVALGFIYDTEDDNYQQARVDYELAANQGDAVAQFNLGLLYEQGKGMPMQVGKAETLFRQAADQGYVPAMVELAGMYLHGALGDRNEKQAIEWYQKAAEKEDRDALYHLGLLSETGVGVELDYAKALKFYQASASRGNAKAMLALARLYQYGQGVPKNNEEAATLYTELAKSGNAYAAYQLAVLTHSGALGEQSKRQTKQWLQLAADNGNQQANQVLQWLTAQMDQRVSYIEPVSWQVPVTATEEPAHWMYLGVLSEWNQGNEDSSRVMLNQLLREYPNYEPAKEAYHNLQAQGDWGKSAQL